ncbi:hCG1978920 [Homo sapiens]|uniref:Putative uncharacterized protein C6orf50 n=1 Tax=Homo sapiens TaxID=9606 RepID=CF050_HUMAN|nr:RecName: Full=Putative uncharacterized protein C6orf50; AltName: Full=Nasopharyngeal carcinoma-associated gene 19 protein [Homo sapiens]AAF99586.1 NAG19 [Homo sapiens]EAW55145.1 hCG1978920 [Homo sapiens]
MANTQLDHLHYTTEFTRNDLLIICKKFNLMLMDEDIISLLAIFIKMCLWLWKQFLKRGSKCSETSELLEKVKLQLAFTAYKYVDICFPEQMAYSRYIRWYIH